MTREFVWTSAFLRGWERCGFVIDDLAVLEQALPEDPKAGRVIQGTGGARKFRFAFEGRGKSGSARIIYVDYTKAEKSGLTDAEKNAIKKMIETIEPYYNTPSGKEE